MKSRGQKAITNVITGLLEEIITMICGFILPRLILSTYGSTYNGLVSSISQFISVVSLMKAGIGGVTRVALYKPLAEKDYRSISAIINQTEIFMRKIATIFIIFVLVFACVYSYYIRADFDWWFSFTLIIIISLSTFAQYYFGFTYQMLISASQNARVIHYINIITTIANTIIASTLILMGVGIHVVKLGSAVVFVISPIILRVYTRRLFNIDKTVSANEDLLKQRWDAVAHEVANFVNNNTDIMVLTIFTGLQSVSIYTVHYLVINNLRKVVDSFISSFGAAFGDMLARKETRVLEENVGIFELIVFSLVSIIYSTTFVMLTHFVMLYTHGVNDANYFQPLFALLITLAGAFSCIRIPYETIVKAAGHYKQTKKYAIIEAVINIFVSIACVVKFGLVGVAIGTLVAAIYRTVHFATYLSGEVVKRNIGLFLKHLLIVLLIFVIVFFASKFYLGPIENALEWILYALITTLLAITLTLGSNLLFYKADFFIMTTKIKNSLYMTRSRNA